MEEEIEELKQLLYSGTITQYGKRELIKYYENQIKEQEQVIDEMAEKIVNLLYEYQWTDRQREDYIENRGLKDIKQYFINKVKENK